MILGHCHVGPPGHFHRMWDQFGDDDGTPGTLDGYLSGLGFDRAVVFAPFRKWFDGDPNRWLLDLAREDGRLVPGASMASFAGPAGQAPAELVPWVTVNEGGKAAMEMLAACAPLGARGIKFHPPIIEVAIDDPGLGEFYGLAESLRMPVLYHTGPHGWKVESYRPSLVGAVAREHPDLPLIIEHLGGAGFARETLAVMKANRNVYGGLTTCLPAAATWHVPPDEINMMIRLLGPERFVFGADYPWNGVGENQAALEVLDGFGLSPADRASILSGNLERLDSGIGTPRK